MWDAVVCIYSAKRTLTSQRPQSLPPIRVSISMHCDHTKAITPFAKRIMLPAPGTTRCSYPGIGVSRMELLFGAAYTYGKSMDDGSNQRDIIPDTYDAHNLWGPSEFDVRHILIVNFLYELPFFHNQTSFASKLLGGWQISGIFQAQTGTPCSVGKSNDYARVGLDGSMCGIGEYWAINGPITYVKKFDSASANPGAQANYWFQTTTSSGSPIFTPPAPGTLRPAKWCS